jgi:N-acetylglucosamine kinase-like BadF-type ATPase
LTAVVAGLPYLGECRDWDRACPRLLADIIPEVPVLCLNDSFIALFGAQALRPGINLVAGTGSIGCGMSRQGRFARCGGWSETVSDEGSGYWLGLMTCSLFTKQADGRLPRGPLYSLLRDELDLKEDIDFIACFRDHLQGSRKKIAALQILLERAARAGDLSARQAYLAAASELAAIILAVYDQLFAGDSEAVPVSCTGGMIKAGDLITVPLQEQICARKLVWTQPQLPPAGGAILKAMSFAGYSIERIDHIISILKAEVIHHDIH